jgi:hypothetical protein
MKTAPLNFAERQFINRRIPTVILSTVGTLAVLGLLLNIILTLINGGEYFKQRKILKAQAEAKNSLELRLREADKELSSKDTPLLTAEALYLKDILDKKEFSWIEFLDKLETVKPYRTIINDINPNVLKDKTVYVKVKGLAQPRDEIYKFEENIFNSKFFAKPHVINEELDKQSTWQSFDLECIYFPGGRK